MTITIQIKAPCNANKNNIRKETGTFKAGEHNNVSRNNPVVTPIIRIFILLIPVALS
jgi:hypothetical protein